MDFCSGFVGHQWKKNTCRNCFQSREGHDPPKHVPGPSPCEKTYASTPQERNGKNILNPMNRQSAIFTKITVSKPEAIYGNLLCEAKYDKSAFNFLDAPSKPSDINTKSTGHGTSAQISFIYPYATFSARPKNSKYFKRRTLLYKNSPIILIEG
jgi:hypothetical protein